MLASSEQASPPPAMDTSESAEIPTKEGENGDTSSDEEAPMETESPDSGHDSSNTSMVTLTEEEATAYIKDLEKRLSAAEAATEKNKRNLLTVNRHQQSLFSRVLRTERDEVKG